MRNIAMLLAAPMALISISASAESVKPEIEILRLEAPQGDVDAGNPRSWVNIGADPFRGDVAKGAAVLSAKTAYNPADFLEGARMRSLGQCIRYNLKDEDVLRTTYELDRSMLARVAFAPGKTRGSDVCIVQRHGDKARGIVFPDGCTNLSAATVILRVIFAQQPVERPRPRGRSATMMTTPGASQPVNQPFGLGVILFDGGGHTTAVQNGSVSASGSKAKSTSGNCCKSNPGHISGE